MFRHICRNNSVVFHSKNSTCTKLYDLKLAARINFLGSRCGYVSSAILNSMGLKCKIFITDHNGMNITVIFATCNSSPTKQNIT